MRKVTDFFKKHHKSPSFCMAAILLFCILTIALPIFIAGFPFGSDEKQHLRFAVAYRDSLSTGEFVPKWTLDNAGFGSIGVRFYPPLVYLSSAFLEMIFGNWYDAFAFNLFCWMFLGCVGVYLFCKEWVSPPTAMLGGLLFAIIPYHLTQVYQYFLYAEFAALSLLPFCFLFVTRVCRRGDWIDVLHLAIAFSLLTLTHLPLTIIATISLSIYALLLLDWSSAGKTFGKFFVAGGLSLAATAIEWVKIVTEIHWVAHDDATYTSGHFSYRVWLFPNVLEPRELYIYTVVSRLFDITIILTVLLIFPATIYLITKAKAKNGDPKIILALVVTTLFSFFMLTRASLFVWEYVPILQKLQFPWRWLSPLSFLCVTSFVIGMKLLIAEQKKLTRLYVYLGLSLLLAISIYDVTQTIVPAGGSNRAEFGELVAHLHDSPAAEYWWPVWANYPAFRRAEKVGSGKRNVDIAVWDAESREFNVGEGEPVDLRVATFYYPFWKATVNAQQVEVKMDENGVILIPVGAEAARVHLYFEEPFIERAALWVSLVTWTGMLVALGVFLKNKFIGTGPTSDPENQKTLSEK